MALNERIGPSSRERLTTLAKSIGREEFAMNVLEIPSDKVLDDLADQLAELYDMRSVNESINLSDYNEELEFVIDGGIRLYPSRVKDVMYYIHNNWMERNISDDEAMKKISSFISPMKENVAPNHDGKSAPYGSGYKKLKKAIDESLRDWFKKENWVRINTSGNIAGKCGTMKKGKATTRCLPKKKAQSLTKAERKATVAKKVRGSKKGKQFVKNTSKAKFKKK